MNGVIISASTLSSSVNGHQAPTNSEPLKELPARKKVRSLLPHTEHVKQFLGELDKVKELSLMKRVSFHEATKTPNHHMKSAEKSNSKPLEKPKPAAKTKSTKKPATPETPVTKTEEDPTEGMKKADDSKRKPSTDSRNEELIKQQYTEEEVDYTLAAKEKMKLEEEKAYKWVERSIDIVYWIASFLTLIASLLTALATYIFVYLPKAVYSQHILNEIFLFTDDIMSINNFGRGVGLHFATFLPLVIVLMFFMVLYIAYLVQYLKPSKITRIMRYCIFVTFELYLILCMFSYSIDASKTEGRLDEFFEHDKIGLKPDAGKPPNKKLFYLSHSQEYFGCCGYRSRKEWKDSYPQDYDDRWPLSCCDAELSEIACYEPVKEKVTYIPPAPEGEKPKTDNVTMDRLQEEVCFESEHETVVWVVCLAIVLIFLFIALSSWSLVVIARMTITVTTRNMEINRKPQYVDFF